MLALAVSVWSVFGAGTVNTQNNSTINLNPNVTHQTIKGWEATDEAAAFNDANFSTGTNNRNPRFAGYKDTLFGMAANDVGINRIRIEVRPGFENTVDYFLQYLDGKIPKNQMAVGRGTPINDNADPNVLNANGFAWGELDFKIDNIVKPLRDRLLARGETLHVNASYLGNDDPNVFQKTPAEYAEFMLAVFQHMQQKYGFVPDTWEVMNEPDLSVPYGNWTAQQIGQIIAAAGPKLAQQGITAQFGTPSVAQANFTFTWWDQIVAIPGVLPYLSEYVYHRYGSPPTVVEMNAIRDRAAKHGKTTAQLEHLSSNFTELHNDLKYANVSAWQHYILAGERPCCSIDYFTVDVSNPNAPIVQVGTQTKFYRQYFKHVRKGAVRYDATTTNSDFDPLAFRNTDGRHVVVVKANAAGAFSVGNLPAGAYGIFYTTGSPGVIANYDVNLPDVVVASAGSVSTSIPGPGVITIYAKASGLTLPPAAPGNLRIVR